MTDNTIHAYAALEAGAALVPYDFDAGELQAQIFLLFLKKYP